MRLQLVHECMGINGNNIWKMEEKWMKMAKKRPRCVFLCNLYMCRKIVRKFVQNDKRLVLEISAYPGDFGCEDFTWRVNTAYLFAGEFRKQQNTGVKPGHFHDVYGPVFN